MTLVLVLVYTRYKPKKILPCDKNILSYQRFPCIYCNASNVVCVSCSSVMDIVIATYNVKLACIFLSHISFYVLVYCWYTCLRTPFLSPYFSSFLNTLSQMDLKIVSFNVNGLLNPTNRKAIFDYLTTIPARIFLLQETHSTVQFEQAWANEWKHGQSIFHSSHENKHHSGVATLVNSSIFIWKKLVMT